MKLPANNMFQSRFLEVLRSLEVIVEVLKHLIKIRRKWYQRDHKLKKGPNFHFCCMILVFNGFFKCHDLGNFIIKALYFQMYPL